MPRALFRAVGVLLAIGVGIGTTSASEQAPVAEKTSRQEPEQKETRIEDTALTEGHARLEEMKVELALLADPVLFHYYVGARCENGELELRGFVPSEKVKQRALDLAHRATYLSVRSALKVQSQRTTLPGLRPAQVLQQEAAELLVQHFGPARGKIGLQARPNGLIMVTGPIDSMETKLAVSRLFRQVPGCYGVLNELSVQENLRDGKRVVPITTGSLIVPSTALPQQRDPLPSLVPEEAPTPAVVPPPPPVKTTPIPQAESRVPLRNTSSPRTRRSVENDLHGQSVAPDATASELAQPDRQARQRDNSLPSAMPIGPAQERKAQTADAMTAPALPKNWNRPAMTWESDNKSPTPATAAVPTTPPANPPSSLSKPTTAHTAALPIAAPPNHAGQRPGSEESETRSNAAPIAQPIRSGRRWPPAYEVKPQAPRNVQVPVRISNTDNPPAKPVAPVPEKVKAGVIAIDDEKPQAQVAAQPSSKGQAGVIVFDEEKPPVAAAEKASAHGQAGVIVFDDEPAVNLKSIGAISPWSPEELQRQVKSACGRQASEVFVEGQRDGSVNVRVRLRNAADENLVTSRILAIPGMGSSKVRLLVDIGP